jgi:hypothetical protein
MVVEILEEGLLAAAAAIALEHQIRVVHGR